ncbi:3-hydroxyacyl-CoA dehydrogenase [Streptomyces dengpaensis]|uniref:3-hydroxyacyl-CoA dehydrogenase n=1 Tax=Streptomyces dengpaensis TaxID=2049881 RepID=A0ABN5ID62_9ACTN|nr:3-hydroxyacyl-CoA dehydrogenase [Streptomyces dengpaensis]AVH60998.1 3-hydroxyacyl-CoA dehydrogenase [Streptomyces dengpaensis]PIB07074.1 3-hydroxyacyl-CoA dehydrogenase [Streptomyces sp. HG99]
MTSTDVEPAHGPTEPVAIAGAGSIGVAFAIVFARAGHEVRLWDPYPAALERANDELLDRLDQLSVHGLVETPSAVSERVTFARELAEAVEGVALVQECAPERVGVKQDLIRSAAQSAPAEAVFASSSSAIRPSLIAADLPEGLGERILIGHPGNPPYLIPVIELVPSPSTATWAVERARTVYTGAGLRPITVNHEPEGFVFNRLQGAILREAYCLVRDGVATVDEIDEVVRSGLGRRWSLIGPFETVDLNTRGGLESHAEKMGPAYARMGAERGQNDQWTPDLVSTAVRQRRTLLPLDRWEERVRWRDEQLMRLTPLWEDIRGTS